MRFIQHKTNNHVFGAPKGWDQKALDVGALPVTISKGEDGLTVMSSFWKPDAEEIAAILRGAPVVLQVVGQTHPIVGVYVSDDT
jgi:hypothetical protein